MKARWSWRPLATPVVALASLYFVTRYAAAGDPTARTFAIAASLLLVVLAYARYLRARAPSPTLAGASAAALVVAYAGAWLRVPGFGEAVLAAHASVAAALFFAAREERQAPESLGRAARTALLLLAALGPAMVQAANNLSFLPGLTLAPYLAALVALGFGAYAVVLLTAPPTLSRSALAVLAAGFTASLILLPSLRDQLRADGRLLFDFFALFAVVTAIMAVMARLSGRFLMTSLAVFAALQVHGIARTLAGEGAAAAAGPPSKLPAEVADLEPVDTPNVYVLVYDGVPELSTLEALGFDSRPERRILAKHGFKLYPGTLALSSSSLLSMAQTLDMHEQLRWPAELQELRFERQGPFYQRVRGGFSAAHHVFRHLGYHSYAIMSAYLVGNVHEVDEVLPEGADPRLELAATLLRGVLQGEFRADTMGWSRRDGSQFLFEEKLAVIAGGRPRRYVESHLYLPGHSQNSGRCLPNESELWLERYRQALELMEQDFAAIEENDPTAIVVAMSDHGPNLTGERCTALDGIELEEITRFDVLDSYSTMVAIRWPDPARAARYDGDLRINPDIFPTVFAYLYDSPVPLGWKVPREIDWRGHVFMRDGEFIPYRRQQASASAAP